MITLYALVGVDPHVQGLPLFRKFLRHYLDNGIRDFVFDLHTNHGDFDRVAQYRELAERVGARIRHVVDESFSVRGIQFGHLNSFIEEYCGTERWCIPVDCDEFIKFPSGDAPTFFEACDRDGYNLVLGNLLDRLCLDSPFAEIGDDKTLDKLFPWSYPLTRQIRRGWDRKVVGFKGRFAAINGHHGLKKEFGRLASQLESCFMSFVDRIKSRRLRTALRRIYPYLEIPAPGIRRWPGRLEIHHMAWDSLLEAKMRARLQMQGSVLGEYHNVLRFIGEADPSRRLQKHLLEKASLEG